MIKSEACSRNTSSGLEKLNDLAIATEYRLASFSGKSRVLGGCIWSRCLGKHRQRGSSHHSAPHSTTVLHTPPQCPTVLRGGHRAV